MPSKQLYTCDACFGKLDNYKSWTIDLLKGGWTIIRTRDGNSRFICPECIEFTKGVLSLSDIPFTIAKITDGSGPDLLTICR